MDIKAKESYMRDYGSNFGGFIYELHIVTVQMILWKVQYRRYREVASVKRPKVIKKTSQMWLAT
jgi:hypothetical protein